MAAPTITTIVPNSGPTAGGTTVTITGTGFATVTAVAFGATPAADYAILSATLLVAIAPAGTGAVALTVTNPDGAASLTYGYGDGLFTIAEARAFNDAALADASAYSDAEIIAFEAAFREWFERAAAVNFIPTTHTDEIHNGPGSDLLRLDWRRVTAVSAASLRSGSTWTPLTVDELALVGVDSGSTCTIFWDGGYWPSGRANVKVTYVAGHATVPALVKEAALTACAEGLPVQTVPYEATSYDAGGGSYAFERADGYRGVWSKLPIVMRALRLYGYGVVVIA